MWLLLRAGTALLLCLSAVECTSSSVKLFNVSSGDCPEGEVAIQSVEAYVSNCMHVSAQLLYCIGKTDDQCLKPTEYVTCQNTTEDCSIENMVPEHHNKSLRVVTPRFCWPSDKRGCVRKRGCVFTYRLEDAAEKRKRRIIVGIMIVIGLILVYVCFFS